MVRVVRRVRGSAAVIAVGALVFGLAVACNGGDAEVEASPGEAAAAAPAQPADGPAVATTLAAGEAPGDGSHLSPDAFTIAVEPIGHWHVLGAKQLLFTVQDSESEEGVGGVNLVVQIAQAGSDRVTERSVEGEQVVDQGNGNYSLEYTPSSIGAYSMVARFMHEGQAFVAQPLAFEVAKNGEEGIQVDAGGNSFVYQIRYHWDPGHGHGSDTEPVKLVFEIMRGIPEGDEINWEQPWLNTLNHITDADHAEIMIQSEDGSVSEEIHPAYMGKGVYQAERIFSVAEVGDGAEYTVRFGFTDPYNDAHVTHAELFHLKVSAPH